MRDKCPFCGNKENPSSSNSEDSCHWVGEYGEKFKGLRSLPCYERQLAQRQERLAVAEGLLKIYYKKFDEWANRLKAALEGK